MQQKLVSLSREHDDRGNWPWCRLPSSSDIRRCKNPSLQAIEHFRQEMREEVKFTNQHAHMMCMEAYNASATATEMKNTTDSLVKLHGLAARTVLQVNININGTRQLERMTDEDLLKIAGKDMDYLEPKGDWK